MRPTAAGLTPLGLRIKCRGKRRAGGGGGVGARLMNANQLPVGWSIMDAGHVDPGRTRRRFQGRITEEVLSGPLKRARG